MRIKKIVSIFLTAALILSTLPVLGSAEETEIFKVGVEALPATSTVSSTPLVLNQGEEITVTISASQNTGITDTRLVVDYDETLLELVEGKYTATELFTDDDALVKYSNKEFGECLVFMSSSYPKVSKQTGIFAKVTFKVKAACSAATAINVQELNEGKESFNGVNHVTVECETPSIAIHKIDVNSGVVTAPTCTDEGYTTYICQDETCKAAVIVDVVPANGHSSMAEPVVENYVDSNCTDAGSFDDVIYCTVCNEELSRVTQLISAKGHDPLAAVEENRKDATCTDKGSYDMVVYCGREGCGVELTREQEYILPEGHKPGTAVIENRVDSTCVVAGSYDSVIYCTVCNEEQSRVTVALPLLTTHVAGSAVIEKVVNPTCTDEGSYDNVIYCTVDGCGKELSRETVTVAAKGHTAATTPVIENYVDPTCSKMGSYDSVIYCTVENCNAEISREKKEVEMIPHTLVKHDAQEATHTQIGWDAYETCEKCDYTTYVEIPMVPYMTGDVTGDDKLTDADAVYLLYAIFNAEQYPLNQEADYNGDGKVTDADAVYLLYAIFNPDNYPLA